MADFSLPRYTYPRITPTGKKSEVLYPNEMQLVLREAEQLGITWKNIPDGDVCKFTYGNHIEYMRKGTASTNCLTGIWICMNKSLTHSILSDAHLPIPRGFSIFNDDSQEYRKQVFEALTHPLVVKPWRGSHGKGVRPNITTLEEMNEWIDILFLNMLEGTGANKGSVLIEETAQGEEYRIIVTKEKVLAVMNRQPASVIGDGSKTIQQLIDEKNTNPLRNISEDLYPNIHPDDDMKRILQKSSYTLESIPKQGTKVVLREISNVIAGGDAYDVTDEIHPTVAEIAVKAIQAIPGMSLVGLDFMTTDITKDQSTQLHAIIEVNFAPQFDMHDIPMHGKKRNVAKAILLMMFPELGG